MAVCTCTLSCFVRLPARLFNIPPPTKIIYFPPEVIVINAIRSDLNRTQRSAALFFFAVSFYFSIDHIAVAISKCCADQQVSKSLSLLFVTYSTLSCSRSRSSLCWCVCMCVSACGSLCGTHYVKYHFKNRHAISCTVDNSFCFFPQFLLLFAGSSSFNWQWQKRNNPSGARGSYRKYSI